MQFSVGYPTVRRIINNPKSINNRPNELYAASPSKGVYKSLEGGATWLDISRGISDPSSGTAPDVSDFTLFNGHLFASTQGRAGASIFKLDSLTRDLWLEFNNGLSSLSTNVNSIASMVCLNNSIHSLKIAIKLCQHKFRTL